MSADQADTAASSASFKAWPRISIVTPSFNQGEYLERTIQSVLSQDYPNLEYLVIDGNSTDDSVAIIQRYARHLTYWESEPDRGVGHALNKGFARATGEIMGWLNADDVFLPKALHIVGQIFHDYPAIQWLTSGSLNITSDDRLFVLQTSRKWFSRWTQFFHRSLPPQHCTFWRRSLWIRAGGHVVEDTRYMDAELWLRFYEHGRPYVADTIFGAWRLHPTSYSALHIQELQKNLEAAQRPYLAGYLQRHPTLRPWMPLLKFYFHHLDRDILHRVVFELHLRRRQFLTFDLGTGRFQLKAGGLLPRSWTFTVGALQPANTPEPSHVPRERKWVNEYDASGR